MNGRIEAGRHYKPSIKNMPELEAARTRRDEAFAEFVAHNSKATKHSLKARAAQKAYTLAADEVRAMEREVLAYGVV